MTGLRVLVVDDERPALDELAYLLAQDDRVGEVLTCDSATQGLVTLQAEEVDAVFLDIQMPGLSGIELAQVLTRFRTPPAIVFVTAHEEHAVDAFELRAVDYVLKPVRADRLAEAVRRVVDGNGAPADHDLEVPVERGGVTRIVRRSEITHVEAQGDYARLHTADGSHLLRVPLTQLETEWAPAGLRAHPPLAAGRARARGRAPDGRRPLLGAAQRRDRARRQPATDPRAARALPAACPVTASDRR